MMELILFYFYATMALYSSLMVIGVKNPVHSVLFLILSFISVSCLLFLLRIEFLSLLFIIIYVGAIGVLFLFVVMMLDIKIKEYRLNKFDYFPVVSFLMLPLLYFFTDLCDSFFSKWVLVDYTANKNVLNKSLTGLSIQKYSFMNEPYVTIKYKNSGINFIKQPKTANYFYFYSLQKLKFNQINKEYKKQIPDNKTLIKNMKKTSFYDNKNLTVNSLFNYLNSNEFQKINSKKNKFENISYYKMYCYYYNILEFKLLTTMSLMFWNTDFMGEKQKKLIQSPVLINKITKLFYDTTSYDQIFKDNSQITPVIFATNSTVGNIFFKWLGYKNLKNWYNSVDFISDIKSFGQIFYTYHFVQFVLIGLILLVALIGSIVLTLTYHKTKNTQNINNQIVKNYNNAIFFVKK
jgi:NADH:ubiquinone oxidoreductase subunit 6 (subunit J)